MKKEVFVTLLSHIKREYDMATEISDGINKVFHKNGRPLMEQIDLSELVFSYEFMDEFVELLKKEFDDTEDLIGMFIYENNWGKDAEIGEPKTIGELYNQLVRQKSIENVCDVREFVEKVLKKKTSNYSGVYLLLDNYHKNTMTYKRGKLISASELEDSNVPEQMCKELTIGELCCYYCKNKEVCERINDIIKDYDNNSLF